MKLLILTQKVDKNDDILGFFHGWIAEFAKHCEKVTVIALGTGEYDLPKNVKVLSLGKEKSPGYRIAGKISRLSHSQSIRYIFNFYKYIWQERKNYDEVFAHMNQVYVILGGVFWRLQRKRIGLWYAHGSVSCSLKIAEKITHIIFTSTESGFRMDSKKKKIVGQGIDTNLFKPLNNKEIREKEVFKVISVGRISPIKDYETIIGAIEILHKKGIKIKLNIIGGVGLFSQESYLGGLKKMVADKGLNDIIKFSGSVANSNILCFLRESDLYVNNSHTGSLDKAVLEAMAVGLPILTCNEALDEVLGEYKKKLIFPKKDSEKLANKIKGLVKIGNSEREILGQKLRKIVIENHNLSEFIKRIVNELK